MGDLDYDFQQLKADGFNTIILLLPWTAFSPTLLPNATWDEDLFKKLHVVLRRVSIHLGCVREMHICIFLYQHLANASCTKQTQFTGSGEPHAQLQFTRQPLS